MAGTPGRQGYQNEYELLEHLLSKIESIRAYFIIMKPVHAWSQTSSCTDRNGKLVDLIVPFYQQSW